ncbi:cap2 mRNA methylation [Pleodorina starrii]|uniref:Cap-specific mRNA (nucleoside-2'-O-)-methyltransferase 2 n=1 Tax=Pleodorina starrii TaxID=330485 RepID=A0A9W6F0L9_9CHLO|nr:cap2 mRNA methylation [Pleodorina starrii]GLC52273.1 cap2 mRNA methylation [Pleodorina starrii]GLC76104.1 cap2 mRNA methylation [Pleodorina starrii]
MYRGGGRGRGRGDGQMSPMDLEKYNVHMAKAMEMMKRTVVIETSGCKLPELREFFSGGEWELPDLASNRDGLNETKNRLDEWDRRRWENAASTANPADQVRAKLRSEYRVELGTIAWAKMYETIWQCDMMPRNSPAVEYRERGKAGVVSVHLCEAPGAFIAATNHFVHTHRPDWRWDWMAVSLNPYFEGNDKAAMIEDDALISATQHKWCFGADNSGDIRRIANIRAIWERARQLCRATGCPDGALMVTADGAVDTSMDPNRQEMITASLHYCEVVAALGVLAVGGNFVWKGFTLYEHPSICSLYLMGCLFDRVMVYKPATSKPANSEVYVVGHGFRGVPPDVLELLLENCADDIFTGRSLFRLDRLPADFLATARHAAIYFGNATSEAIADAIALEGLPQHALAPLRRAKQDFAAWWLNELRVMPLDRDKFLAPRMEIDGRRNNTSGKRKGGELTGTLADRQEQHKKRMLDQGLLQSGPEAEPAGFGFGGGGLGLGAGGAGGAGGAAAAGMHVSSAAMAMMAKMGHKEGQGLGRANQGMASALEVSGNRRRAGLGMGQDGPSGPAGAAPDWSLAPDSAVLGCPGPLTEAEAEAWPPLASSGAPPPPQINKSKMLPDDSVLLALRVARRDCCAAGGGPGGAAGGGACRHVQHCLAPRRLHHASRAYWKLAAVDSALDLCRAACHAATRNDSAPHALDLSLLGGAGSTEYLTAAAVAAASDGRPPPPHLDWRVTMLATERARAFAVASPAGDLTVGTDPRVRLQPLPAQHDAAAEPSPLELCTAESSGWMAEAVPGCWLVLGDLGSLRRLQDGRLGVLEGELSPAYRRALLWEVATALGCLAPGGCAVFRLGGCLTFFSTSLLYLLHRSFSQIAVVKPFACCAASSERLVVAMGCLDDVAVARRRVMEALAEAEVMEVPPGHGPLPAVQLGELVPAGLLVRSADFLRYMESRTTALAEREAQHCRAAAEAAAAGEPLPSEEELAALGQQADRVLEAGAPPPAAAGEAGASGGDLYGGVFTRGGLGSDPQQHPHHRQQKQLGWSGAAGGRSGGGGPRGGGGPPVRLAFRLLSRGEKGDEYVCRVRCEAMADVAARTQLDSADAAVARKYYYREDFEPQRRFRHGLQLLPDSDADAARLGRLMDFLANTRKPGGREKVALLSALDPAGAQADGSSACVSLTQRSATDPERDGLLLWC